MTEVKPPAYIDFIYFFSLHLFLRILFRYADAIWFLFAFNSTEWKRVKYFNVLSCILSCIFISFSIACHVTQYRIFYLLNKIKSSNQRRETKEEDIKIVQEEKWKIVLHHYFCLLTQIASLLLCSLKLKQNPCCELRRDSAKERKIEHEE